MNKYFRLLVACAALLLSTASYAASVTPDEAKAAAANFMYFNAGLSNARSVQCELVATYSTHDNNCFYIFNIGDNAFIIVSAQDIVKPVLGYSIESNFNPDDVPTSMAAFLDNYKSEIEYAMKNNIVQTTDIYSEWRELTSSNRGLSPKGTTEVLPLLSTIWRQHWPYNYYCPEDAAGSGGHCYVGCVAMALGMIMKYWEYPLHGTSSHSYNCSGYGMQTANFGDATYLYELMPDDSLRLSSPIEEIEATALMLYHCGVAVDMMYGTSGSGAYVVDIPDAAINYFGFSSEMEHRYRNSYSLNEWITMLKAQFDLGYPVYYSAFDYNANAGHAFNLDGYDNNDMFHINWGWGGNQNGYFAIDAFNTTNYNFNDNTSAIFDIIPDTVYAGTPGPPQNFTVVSDPAYNLFATLSWTNPTSTLGGTALESIDSIIVTRNDVIVNTITSTTPGEVITWVDSTIPDFGTYIYTVYAMTSIGTGQSATQSTVIGPTCTITVNMHDSYGDGWNGASISFFDENNDELANVTLSSGTQQTEVLQLMMGEISCIWNSGSWDSECSFTIYDFENNTLYASSGTPQAGTFFTFDNQCEAVYPCLAPENVTATADGTEAAITVAWNENADAVHYNIYRNGVLIVEDIYEISYTDENLTYSTEYCYFVTSVCENGESGISAAACATTIGSPLPCDPPENVNIASEDNIITITWETPAKEITGYNIFLNGEIIAQNLTENIYNYTDALNGEDYTFGVSAVYAGHQCEESDIIEVTIHYLGTSNFAAGINVYPNPANYIVNIRGDKEMSITVIDALGRIVDKMSGSANYKVNVAKYNRGIYSLQITAGTDVVTRRIVVE